MSKQSIKATINANIKQNGNQAITGQIMNSVLNGMVDNLAEQTETTEKLTDIARKQSELEGNTPKIANDVESDLDIVDKLGNVLARFSDGDFAVKNFDTAKALKASDTETETDLDVCDDDGKVLVRFADGHIQTKNFSSIGDYKGEKINFLGDSITYGYGLSDSTKRYSSVVSSMLGAEEKNYGVSGTTIANNGSQSFVSRVSQLDLSASLTIICGGTNDYWHKGISVGEYNDTDNTTMCGGLNYILNYLHTNAPKMPILFVFPMHQSYGGEPDSTDFGYGTFKDFHDKALMVCEYRGVPCLDLYSNSGLDVANNVAQKNAYTQDGVHPNANGHRLMANKIIKYIKNNL